MAQTIPLKVVIELTGSQASDSVSDSQQGIVHPWPGDPVTLDVTIPPSCLDPVWIATNADGSVADNFPISTPIADILAEGWAHVYQGTQICDSDGNANVYSNQYNHVLLAIAACCNNSFATQALLFKVSPFALIPGQVYPCPTDAAYKWLALKGSNETKPNLTYVFSLSIVNADGTVTLNNTQVAAGPMTSSVQMVLAWPADFVGLIIDGVTLVANDTVPLTGQRQVKDFDGGVIAMAIDINDDDIPENIGNNNAQFALPDTDCLDESAGIFEDQFETQFE